MAPVAERLVEGGTARVVVSLVAVFGAALLFAGAGQLLAMRLGSALDRNLAVADAVLGAGAGVVLTAVALWLVASMLVSVRVAAVAPAIQSSRLLQAADRVLPPAPAFLARVQGLLDPTGLPPVFAGLEPAPAPDQPLPGAAEVAAAASRARASTFKITGTGCGGVQTGSGFLVSPVLVVTNAHVVAGIDHPVIHTGRGARQATPVLFDPELDIAVLRLSSAGGRPLTIVTTEVPSGTPAAVLGYPGGGQLRASAASVAASYQAIGRDVYSRGLARRPVYELRGRIGAGNSGGPVVNARGEVIGVIFSRSALHEDVAFAIRGEAVASKIAAVGRSGSGVVTGRCAA